MQERQLGRQHFGNPEHRGNVLSREEANRLLDEWVLKPGLKLHMRQVAHLMACWAGLELKADEATQWKWELAGLLHDADWDQWPDEHCRKIVLELEARQVDPDVIHAIASHGRHIFGVEPVSDMDRMLYAFDELSGFVHAYSLMRSEGYVGMVVNGVKKRLKDSRFAASVSREDIADAASLAGLDMDTLIGFVVSHQGDFMQG